MDAWACAWVWFSSTITITLAVPGPLGVEALVVAVGGGGVDDQDVGVGGGVAVGAGVVVSDGPVAVGSGGGGVLEPRSSRGAVVDSCASNLAPPCTPASPMEYVPGPVIRPETSTGVHSSRFVPTKPATGDPMRPGWLFQVKSLADQSADATR